MGVWARGPNAAGRWSIAWAMSSPLQPARQNARQAARTALRVNRAKTASLWRSQSAAMSIWKPLVGTMTAQLGPCGWSKRARRASVSLLPPHQSATGGDELSTMLPARA
jgi:hypothetical protein